MESIISAIIELYTYSMTRQCVIVGDLRGGGGVPYLGRGVKQTVDTTVVFMFLLALFTAKAGTSCQRASEYGEPNSTQTHPINL